jgi:hypothetical protein
MSTATLASTGATAASGTSAAPGWFSLQLEHAVRTNSATTAAGAAVRARKEGRSLIIGARYPESSARGIDETRRRTAHLDPMTHLPPVGPRDQADRCWTMLDA